MASFKVKHVKPEAVMSVYSGKKNKCMCGCAGKWYYRNAAQSPGYEVERDDRMVAVMAAKMNRVAAYCDEGMEYNDDYRPLAMVEFGNRVYVARFE